MIEDLSDDCWVFDAGDNLHAAAAAFTGSNIDLEHASSPKADAKTS